MWLLVVLCISTVGCVPLNMTRNTTGDAQVGAAILNAHVKPTNMPASVGGVPLNAKGNATSKAAVDAVPLNNTNNATTQVQLGIPSTLKDGGVPLNDKGNATSKATVPEQQQDSAETLEELDDDTVVEGDILMPEDRNAVESIWAHGVVPFAISDELAHQRDNIYAALQMISEVTCVIFIPHTTQYNYINFVSGRGCASFVGAQGGAQKLFFSPSCSVGNICHEVIHALGIHHEHTRDDRDQHVSVEWEHIKHGKSKNFKVKHGNIQNLPYDTDSIMHYGKHFFSIDGSPTILTKQRGVNIGQRKHLSHLDIQRINRLYRCDSMW